MERCYAIALNQRKATNMTASIKSILTEIHHRQLKTFCKWEDFDQDGLPRRHRGLYWIWSVLSFDKLQKIPTRPDTKEVPISELVSQRRDLNVNKISLDGFTIVYNGIGGYRKTPANFGLRERIRQEFSCTDRRTGTLKICRTDAALMRKIGQCPISTSTTQATQKS